MNISEEDFDSKYAKTFEWTADNQLRRFRITRHDGTVKEILFAEILENQKIRDKIKEWIENSNHLHSHKNSRREDPDNIRNNFGGGFNSGFYRAFCEIEKILSTNKDAPEVTEN